MSTDFIEYFTERLSRDFSRKYKMNINGLREFSKLKPRSQELLLDMLVKTGQGCDMNDLLIRGTYKTFGFKSFSNFHKYRQNLIDRKFIQQSGDGYLVNPAYIIYFNKNQRTYFYGLFGLLKEVKVNFFK